MNKLGYQPLTVIMKAEPSDSGWPSNSAKLLRVAAALGTLIVLGGVAAVCFIGFGVVQPGLTGAKQSVEVAPLPAASPATETVLESHLGAAIPDPKPAIEGTAATDDSVIVQSPTPAPNTAPVTLTAPPRSEAQAGQRAIPTEARRKKLERARRAAERERSQLEADYEQHAISGAVYKEGEKKYRAEIERYRREMNLGKGPKDASGF
jgi:hypothetical protein